MGGHTTERDSYLTLIEGLILLATLGILLGLVAMGLGELRIDPQRRALLTEKDTVQVAIDTYNHQDLGANGTTPISARRIPAPIAFADRSAPFSKYLRRETQYRYSWGYNGKALAVAP